MHKHQTIKHQTIMLQQQQKAKFKSQLNIQTIIQHQQLKAKQLMREAILMKEIQHIDSGTNMTMRPIKMTMRLI